MSVSRNASYNLIGFVIPSALALLTVPAYLKIIGVERYGVLALAWAVLGYFGLFDLGLGRATAQRLAFLRDAVATERSTALHTALRVNLAVGIAGGLVLFGAGQLVFGQAMSLSPKLRTEAFTSLPLLAATLPLATTSGVLSGALMARERFLDVNRISIASTALLQLLPLAVAWLLSPVVWAVLAAAIVARLVGCVLLYHAVRSELVHTAVRWSPAEARRLLSFGGWVTVTAVIGPVLVLSDRFVIGGLIGVAAVTIYTVPMDASARLGGVAAAIGNALFPRLAYLDSEDARILIRQAIGALYAILTPPVAAAVILMDPALRLWLGDALGGQAAPIARILLIACWLNAFAQMPFARLQASGRPDVVGKLHSIEVPLYLAFLFGAIVKFGLLGAAFAFLGRTVIDAAALFLANSRRIDHGVALSGTLTALLALAAFLGLEPTRLDVDRAILGAIAAAAASGFAALVVMPRPLRQGCARALRVLWRRTLSQ